MKEDRAASSRQQDQNKVFLVRAVKKALQERDGLALNLLAAAPGRQAIHRASPALKLISRAHSALATISAKAFMNNAVNTRERFLQEAAASLSGSSPTSADHFRRNAALIRATREGASQSPSSGCCPACGSLDIGSRDVEVKRKRKNPAEGHPTFDKQVEAQRLHIRKCRKCSRSVRRIVRVAVSNPGPQITDFRAEKKETPTVEVPFPAPQPQATKSSSKKRAKERKDREGLRAMMDESKDKSTTSGFSLMDFMSSSGR